MKARPSFQFYPADWLRDPGLRSCSLGARGLWIDMLSFMHEAEPYGHLRINGHDIGLVAIARMIGSPLKDLRRHLAELEAAGVFSRTDGGTIFSRRMVRDEEIRIKRAEGGSLSLQNPRVPARKDGGKDTLPQSIGGAFEGSPSSSDFFLPVSTSEKQEGAESSVSVERSRSRQRMNRLETEWPEGFQFNERHKAIAEGLGLNVHTEFVKFKDKAQAHGWRYADWEAGFRTWLNKADEFKQQRRAG